MEIQQPPITAFDRSKPFYPLTVIYIAQWHGLRQLQLRGYLQFMHERHGSPTLDDLLSGIQTGNAEVDAGIMSFSDPSLLRAEASDEYLRTSVDDIVREIVTSPEALYPSLLPAVGSILLLAEEIVKQQLSETERQEPMLQFLKHVRNVIAHDGRMQLKPRRRKGAPWLPAAWRKFTLSPAMHGERLFMDKSGKGLLGSGDPFLLLWDIEQAYPSLKA